MRIAYYIYHSLLHLKKGTLSNYLRQEWSEYLKRRSFRTRQRRRIYWELQAGKREVLEVSIQPSLRMKLYLDSDLCRLIHSGSFECKERQFLNAFLRPGDIFVDVGANIGLFTLIAAQRVGKSGSVYAFEPYTKTYNRLLINVQLNNFTNVTCHKLALSDSIKRQSMTISLDGFDAWNSLAKPIKGERLGVEMVETITWDKFADQHNLVEKVAMMKIDVEGWEKYVLAGAAETLYRINAPTLQVEFTEEASQAASSSCKELYYTLENFGYKMYTYDARYKTIVHHPFQGNYPYLNLIATKTPDKVKERLKRGKYPSWIR
ncbi:MAG: FkbM family methyltransferase [Coleofasciculus sp. C1-SOL-03]|uniref:FkbM family methyltransferase n=1 Tax=Coleofasciculus sp. C1-SOL-03 TaxID=3069522 RepID=UPI0032FC7022